MKKGMSKDEIFNSQGKPNYQYAISGEETWVYENKNIVTERAKETAINMVPVAGPVVSLFTGMDPKLEQVKSAVTFDNKGKVKSFQQIPNQQPVAAINPLAKTKDQAVQKATDKTAEATKDAAVKAVKKRN